MEFFVNSILPIIVSLFVLALAAGGLLWIKKEKRRAETNSEVETAQRALFISRAESWLRGALPALITKVENDWFRSETKCGPLKLSAVKAELMNIAPPELIATFNELSLNHMIETALVAVRDIWEELPDLLLENQIARYDEEAMCVAPEVGTQTPNESVQGVTNYFLETLAAHDCSLKVEDGTLYVVKNVPDEPEINGDEDAGEPALAEAVPQGACGCDRERGEGCSNCPDDDCPAENSGDEAESA